MGTQFGGKRRSSITTQKARIGFGVLAIPVIQRYWPFGNNLEATVQAAEGQVYQIADTKSSPVTAGERLQKGEKIRTAKDAHAFIRLGDGSVIEVKDRSEFSITRNAQGTTIHLERGNIVGATPAVHEELLAVIGRHVDEAELDRRSMNRALASE